MCRKAAQWYNASSVCVRVWVSYQRVRGGEKRRNAGSGKNELPLEKPLLQVLYNLKGNHGSACGGHWIRLWSIHFAGSGCTDLFKALFLSVSNGDHSTQFADDCEDQSQECKENER